MKVSLIKLLIVVLLFCSCNTASSQLVITPNLTAQDLAQKLVGNGISISNVSFTGRREMAAFFTNVSGTNIGIDSGIVLTSGRAQTVGTARGVDGNGVTQAQSVLADNGWNLPGDLNLAAAIRALLNNLKDACVLEFDFVPLGDSIKFNYVFSSEEYTPAFVCNFNDAFAFFISGPGITGLKNIALIPNTTTPVSIINVNNVAGVTCNNNMAYYIDNRFNRYTTHDGHTTVLTAKEAVQPCQPYHLKLVIADVGDAAYDSGVFLQAKSLSSSTIGMTSATQTDPATGSNYLAEGCATGSFNIRRPAKDPFPLNVSLSYAGTATNGIDYLSLPASVTIPANDSFVTVNVIPLADGLAEGIEDVIVFALAGCAAGTPTDSTVIQIRDYDILSLTPDSALVCKGGSLQLMASPGFNSYQWQTDPALSNASIRDPVATPLNSASTFTCTATTGACNAKDSVFLRWKDVEFVSKIDVNCRNAVNGQIKVAAGPEWAGPLEFSLDGINWQADSVFNNLSAGSYWVKIRDGSCYDSIQVTVAQAFPDLLFTNITMTAATCSGNPDGTIAMTGGGGNGSFLYSIDGTTFQPGNLFNIAGGSRTISIKDGNGCLYSQDIIVPLNNTVMVDAGPDATICEGSSYLVPAVSNGTSFSWSPGATLDNTTILAPTARPTTTTKYYLVATTGICSKIDSIQIFIRPAPIADAGADVNICYGKIFKLNGSGGLSYQWSPSTYFISSPTLRAPDVKATADISYSLVVTDIFNCRSVVPDIVNINVTPSVRIFAGNDTIAAMNQPMQLQVNEMNNAGVTSYTWTPGTFLSNSNIAAPVATLSADQRFLVVGTTPEGCQGTDDILVKVYKGPDIYVPTGFTPNNDGLNDLLRPIPVGIKEFKFFRVYDRWGQLVYSTQDPQRGWNGKTNGSVQNTGTFIWVAEAIDYKGNLVNRKGVVTIIR